MTPRTDERFLIVAPQGLGDSLEATPLLRALRRARPGATIDVAVTRAGPQLLFESLREYADGVISLPYWERGKRAFLRAMLTARRAPPYDAAFMAYPSAGLVYQGLLAALPARRRYAHRHAGTTILDAPWLHATLVPVRLAANVERNRDLLRAAGIEPGDETGYLVPGDWILPRRGDRIAIHIGSVTHHELIHKRWPLERFVELARRLVERHPDVVLVVGPQEVEESALLQREVPTLQRFEGSLPDVARFLSSCDVVIANDNGIAHLAAGVGTRVVTLFGPTPIEFAPFSPNAIALRPTLCPPCFDVRRPVVRCVRNIDFQCLKRDLTVDLVYETVES
ncbi:MAG: glycosyltransferase family 9 protein, partial [Candidatus Eremiobacteraeota bacterium]|nr:glycosyltransferase family 9 protein [Candidatus Eremiobacteraeota bacterium]